MSVPPPVPAPSAPNRLASAAVAVGIVAVIGGWLLGVFLLHLPPGLVGISAVLLAGAAVVLGAVGIVSAGRRQGRGLASAIIAIVLGLSTFAALFIGRVVGAEVLGLTTWG